MAAEYRLLGTVQLTVDGHPVGLGPTKQRTLLAALLVDAGRHVGIEVLIDRVWGDRPPARPRAALYSYVARLRQILEADGTGRPRLRSGRGGYALDVDRTRVDLHRFRSLVGRALHDDCPDPDRVTLLDEALALWRGRPMADLSSVWVAGLRDGLVQQHQDAVLGWAEAHLRRGQPRTVVGVLREMLAQHPLAEPVAAALIEALHADGRTAEALAQYGSIRQRLVEELGIEPGARLRRLQVTLLRSGSDPADPPPVRSPRPAGLPAGVVGFTGRRAELSQLDDVLVRGSPSAGGVVIWGTAGVGKTALALHWARRAAPHFPDGQLYVNLRGFQAAGTPAGVDEVLRELLDGLGVPARRIPDSVSARATLYRGLLAERRVLVVLDNVATVEQVRPLVPGTPGSLLVVTSRNQLTGLVVAEGLRPVPLDVMAAPEARQLLAHRLGAGRLAAEPAAVDGIVGRCAGLPLSLSIVAARASAHPSFPLAAIAAELAGGGLDRFQTSGPDVRTTMSWSYRTRSHDAARLFRRLGLHPGPDLARPAVACLLDQAGQSRAALGELVDANLVREHRPGRFTFHDLLREYARERAADEESAADRRAVVGRLLDHYLRHAYRAAVLLDPHRTAPANRVPLPDSAELTDRAAATEWLTAEHRVLVAAVELAGQEGFDRHACHLAWALSDYLNIGGHPDDLSAVHQVALAAAERLADHPAQAHSHRCLGRQAAKLGRYAEARRHLSTAAELYAGLGDPYGESLARLDLGWIHSQGGEPAAALAQTARALALARASGHPAGTARALNAFGWCSAENGAYDQALRSCVEALDLLLGLGDQHGIAATQDSLGYVYHRLGRQLEAAAAYELALAGYRELGDRFNAGLTSANLGDALAAAGDTGSAARWYGDALAIFDDLGHPQAATLRAKLESVAGESVAAGAAAATDPSAARVS